MAENEKSRKWLDELRTTPEFQLLTTKQQIFVSAYLSSGRQNGTYDSLAAVRTAYDVSSATNATVLSYEILGNPKIKKVLDLHFNRTEREAFLEDLLRTIARSKGTAKVRAMALYAKMKFGIDTADDSEKQSSVPKPNQDGEAPVFHVGDLVEQEGHVGRVLEVDAAGRATRVEEIHVG
jgi:hypothetical protein